MQTTEQRLERLEKHNKRLTTALTVMVVAMCAVLTMAARHDKESVFDSVAAYTPDDPAWYAVVLSWLTSRRSPRFCTARLGPSSTFCVGGGGA